ncbi:endonuclease/exonuclease/phosphatase family protein [Spirosoma sp.]|uniref:endonuclease/exonuclease/phosphatase family protein n=1 Tax=Spirosoma sp. TaxID=1899569 RepID=UPI00262BDFD7|nr:endonuclease/exonuclease/phosphatase family protein [Spirosoma sp.]MCX6214897.1 endonuclease/exonuclease/phosphatase family protein [Spirosoma sp.]
MQTVDSILLTYAIVVTTASFINFIRLDYWWIRMWDFPHLQLTAMAFIGLVAWAIFSRHTGWPTGIVPVGLFVTLLYQGWLIHRFTPFHKKQVLRVPKHMDQQIADKNTIRLLVSNVYMENTQTPKVWAMAKKYDPDVVLVLEANQRWQDELAPMEASYPYHILHPLENTYGMLLYSRLPMRHHEVRFLIQDDIPSVYIQFELPSGQVIHFYGVHPMPPTPTEHYRSAERDAELLLVGKEARKLKEPVIVAGDLNDVAWSHTTRLFQRVSGLFDPRVGRGLYNTFHANYFLFRWPLDHVFVSHHFKLRKIRRLPNCGSDHFPIFTALTYAPEPDERQEEIPQPEHDDLEEAHEIIERAT